MRVVVRFIGFVALHLGIVVGGLTAFLVLAPVFGYLPYSDRPGPGWFGSFPAVGWADFWAGTWQMLGFGAFLLVGLAPASVIAVAAARRLARGTRRPLLRRVAGAVVSALATGYFMLGAGWYISAGWPLLVLAVLLGAVAAGCCFPRVRRGSSVAGA